MPLKTYSTTFGATENPLSESGAWVNGGTTGLDWADVSSDGSTHRAIGHQTGGTGTDASAVLSDTSWPADHSCQATVFIDALPADTCSPEVELRLRSKISANTNRGYEVSFGLASTPYLLIVRWNGIVGNFTYLLDNTGARYQVVAGDVVSARVVGNVISAYINGKCVGSAKDTTWTDGQPGMGFNLENGAGTCAGANVDYGYTAWSATEIAAPTSGLICAMGAASDGITNTTILTPLEYPIAPNDAILVLFSFDSLTAGIRNINDGSNGANQYELLKRVDAATNSQRTEWWCCPRARVAVAGSPLLVATVGASVTIRDSAAVHYRNGPMRLLSPDGALVTAPGVGSETVVSPTVTVPGIGMPALVVAAATDTGAQSTGIYAAGAGYTMRVQTRGVLNFAIEDKTIAAGANVTGSFTPSVADNSVAYVAVLLSDPQITDYAKFPKPLISRRAQGLS